MASDTENYIFYHIDQDGKLDKKYDHSDGMFACLIDTVNTVQAMLKKNAVRSAFAQMAREFCKAHNSAWFLQTGKGTQETKINNLIQKFLGLFLIPAFPMLCVSHRYKHPRHTGMTFKPTWDNFFELLSVPMILNGVRLETMLNLRMRVGSAEDKEGQILNAYRMMQFQFAVTIFHEMGHVFNVLMGQGRLLTPKTEKDPEPEAGFQLEKMVFGAQIAFFHDKTVQDYGAGTVVMIETVNEVVDNWYGLTKEAIDSIVDMNPEFPFKQHWKKLLNFAECDNLDTAQAGDQHESEKDDPTDHKEWDKTRDEIDPEWKARQEKVIIDASKPL